MESCYRSAVRVKLSSETAEWRDTAKRRKGEWASGRMGERGHTVKGATRIVPKRLKVSAWGFNPRNVAK